jgi:hypothetical protein
MKEYENLKVLPENLEFPENLEKDKSLECFKNNLI